AAQPQPGKQQHAHADEDGHHPWGDLGPDRLEHGQAQQGIAQRGNAGEQTADHDQDRAGNAQLAVAEQRRLLDPQQHVSTLLKSGQRSITPRLLLPFDYLAESVLLPLSGSPVAETAFSRPGTSYGPAAPSVRPHIRACWITHTGEGSSQSA